MIWCDNINQSLQYAIMKTPHQNNISLTVSTEIKNYYLLFIIIIVIVIH